MKSYAHRPRVSPGARGLPLRPPRKRTKLRRNNYAFFNGRVSVLWTLRKHDADGKENVS